LQFSGGLASFNVMNKQITVSLSTRRQFIKYGAMAAGAVALTGPYPVRGQNLNGKLNVAQIGCGSKGSSDYQIMAAAGENVIALCDVRTESASRMKERLSPEAKVYTDYRELLEKEKSLDAIDIATPDHMHAVIAAAAIKMGKHVYCQKPLTHDVFEARTLRELARKHKVATQMGNQGSASDSLRRAVEVMHAGIIGPVHQAYVWTNRPIWPQGKDRPPGSDPVPEGFNWDLWLGTAPERPFKLDWPGQEDSAGGAAGGRRRRGNAVYQPFVWRGWQDFGTGALGDMACHTVNWPFRSLNLGYPTEIEATSTGMNTEMYPSKSNIRFEFPAREKMPAVTLHWSDGGNKPPIEVTADVEALLGRISNSGCIMIGENGLIFSPDDGDQELKSFIKLKGDQELVGLDKHPAASAIPQSVPRNAFKGSPDEKQHKEWLQACRDGKHSVPYSNFDIAAYLTEIILLGCVALRVGKKLEWNGPGMKAKNAPEAAQFVKRHYRKPFVI
jgi:predicted dehydrogenase